MCNRWYINECEDKYIQFIIFSNDYSIKKLRGQLKRIKKVLKEYNLQPKKRINLTCKKYFKKDADNDLIRLNCYVQ